MLHDLHTMETLHSVYPDKIVQLLSTMARNEGQSFRKAVLTLSRYMGLPTDLSSNLYGQVFDTIDLILPEITKLQHSGYLDANLTAWELLDQALHDRLRAGALITAMCIQPYSTEQEENDIREASYLKEKEVIDSRQPTPRVNFNAWDGSYREPLHPAIPHNPDMSKVIHGAIQVTLEQYSDVDITPRYSRKPLPTRVERSLKRKDRDELDSEDGHYYQHHLEILRATKRICLEGGVEMRQRWYANGTGPRTYYVGGPTAFEHARFIQNFFNDLCDSLDVTNRIKRVSVKRLFLHGRKTFLFYDLTSFTSNCVLQRDFIRWLANVARGRILRVTSFGAGTVEKDLGDLLEEYASYVNEYMEWYRDDCDWEGTQGSGGFLGVLGNIASCTFLHGCILLMLSETQSDCGVAGDDAAVLTDSVEKIAGGVSLVGIYQWLKVFVLKPQMSVDSDALYLKRRTFINPRIGNLSQWHYFQFPSMLTPAVMHDPEYTRRYGVELNGTRQDIRRRCISSVTSSFRSARFLPPDVLPAARSILERYYTLLGIPHCGYVPQYDRSNHRIKDPFVPHLDGLGSFDFMESTLTSLYAGWCSVPNREVSLDHLYLAPRYGLVFDTQEGSPILSFLKRTGYVMELGFPGGSSTYTGEAGLHRILAEYLDKGKEKRIRRFIVAKPIPSGAWGGARIELLGVPTSVDDIPTPVCHNPCSLFKKKMLRVPAPRGY